MSTPRVSIIIPVYNERESLPELHRQIADVATAEDISLEIVFVDDGSRDGSWPEIERLAESDTRIAALRFRRNFGKAAALSAGFGVARGEIVVTMDADLQDDPAELPRFVARMDEGHDVVSGWKKVRHDPWHKVYPSRVFNGLVSWLTGVKLHDHNCGFKSYRREIFDEVKLYGELHRFVPVLAAARGWDVTEIVIQHRPRVHGQSKYGVRRFVKGLLDLLTVYFLTGYASRPAHLLGTIGLVCFGIGSVGALILAIAWALNQTLSLGWQPLHERPAVIYSMGLMLLGAQLLSIGFLAELLTAFSQRDEHFYSIKERLQPRTSSQTKASQTIVSQSVSVPSSDTHSESAP